MFALLLGIAACGLGGLACVLGLKASAEIDRVVEAIRAIQEPDWSPDALHPVVSRAALRSDYRERVRLSREADKLLEELQNSGRLKFSATDPLPESEMREIVSNSFRAEEIEETITLALQLNADVAAGRQPRADALKTFERRNRSLGLMEIDSRTREWVGRLRGQNATPRTAPKSLDELLTDLAKSHPADLRSS